MLVVRLKKTPHGVGGAVSQASALLLHSEQVLGSSAPASWSLHVCVGLVQVLRLATYSKHVRLYVEWWLYCYYLSVWAWMTFQSCDELENCLGSPGFKGWQPTFLQTADTCHRLHPTLWFQQNMPHHISHVFTAWLLYQEVEVMMVVELQARRLQNQWLQLTTVFQSICKRDTTG